MINIDKAIRLKDIIDYFLVLLLIIQSGAFFAIKNSSVLLIVFSITNLAVCYFRNNRIDKREMYLTIAIIIFEVINLIITNLDADYISYKISLAYMIRLIGTFLILQTMDYNKLKKNFSQIILVISFISLLVYLYALLENIPKDKEYFGIFRMVQNNGVRNSAIFWEPGAFQLFISLSLVYYLFTGNLKNRLIKIIILVLTMVSTLSTSGYISLAFIMLYYMIVYLKKCNKKKRIIIIIPMVIISIVMLYFILTSDAIKLKFTDKNGSFVLRMHDVTTMLASILDIPILGLGADTQVAHEFFKMHNLNNAISLGIFSFALSHGVLLTLILIGLIMRNIYLLERKRFLLVSGVIFVSMLTEPFFVYPIYMIFYLINPNKEENLNEYTLFRRRIKRTS